MSGTTKRLRDPVTRVIEDICVPGWHGAQLHVVGNAINLNPLQIGLPGNNTATIVPAPGGNMTMSLVTRGSSSFAQKGDVVFLMPVQVAPKSLILAQLVLYKKMPKSEFAP